MNKTVGLVLALWLALAAVAIADAFTYHDYDGMVSELTALAAAYPALTDHFTAQDRFGLPTVADGEVDLEHHMLRITNEALGFDKPEVLLVGVQHGDEVVSLEVLLATARLLLESYGSDAWLTDLVDRREIYIVPLANPHGFRYGVRVSPGSEPGSEDMNRDHVYDRCEFSCSDDTSLSTVGALAIHELARRHLFRVMLDFHGGVELIIHPWGSPLHPQHPETESPDDGAMGLLGDRMSAFGGPYNGFYPVGTASDLLGAVNGPLDDTAYAATWDAANADAAWPTDGWGGLSYTIEISNAKKPPVATLGGDAELLVPDGAEDGYVPKNVRIALAAIDVIEPFVVWTNRGAIPTEVTVGEPLTVTWQVRGCFEVDDTRVRSGTGIDPVTDFTAETASQTDTAEPCFGNLKTFTADVSFAEPGTYYLTPVAKVDSSLLDQVDPTPPLTPRSWLVRSRTEEAFYFENTFELSEINTITGALYRGAEPLQIEVTDTVFADGFESGNTSAWSFRKLASSPQG
jgi:hypothetical protein